MPHDKNGDFWSPTCGVDRCVRRHCFAYSRIYQICSIVRKARLWEKATEASILVNIANPHHSLQQKVHAIVEIMERSQNHAETAIPVMPNITINNNDERRRRMEACKIGRF